MFAIGKVRYAKHHAGVKLAIHSSESHMKIVRGSVGLESLAHGYRVTRDRAHVCWRFQLPLPGWRNMLLLDLRNNP
jgi:hypothetical protein